jgi:hypothetical protein
LDDSADEEEFSQKKGHNSKMRRTAVPSKSDHDRYWFFPQSIGDLNNLTD